MKTKADITKVNAAKAVKLVVCCGFFANSYLSAQSIDIFQTLHGASQNSSGGATKASPDAELLKSKPSRFSVSNVELYASARMADFFMNDKTMDAFGLYQDPNIKPVIKNFPTAPGNLGHILGVPLADIIKRIKVSTVMVKEKSFLVGVRVFKESEEFDITFQEGRTKRLKVLKVDAKEITFKDIYGGEEATLTLDVLPLGMAPGDERLRPAGMVDTKEKQVLNLEIK